MKFVWTLLLCVALGACLSAQATLPAAVAAPPPPRLPVKKLMLAAAAGAAAGALVGTRALSFSALPAYERNAHEWRAGLTYGTIGGVLGAAMAASLSPDDLAQPHSFWWNRANTPLFVGIAAVQVLDFTSTRYFRDRGKDEWLLTDQLVDNRAAFAATEIAAGAAGIGLCYLLHRTGHHRLERWAAAAYIGVGATSAIANYRYPSTGHDLFGQ